MIAFEFASYDLMLAGTVSAVIPTALLVLKAFISRQLRRLSSDDRLQFLTYPEQIVNATRLPFMLGIALLAGMRLLDFSPHHDKWLHFAWIIILVSQVAMWGNRIVSVAVQRAFRWSR